MPSLEKMAKTLLSGVSENNLLIKNLLTETLRRQDTLIEQNRMLLEKTAEICTLIDCLRTDRKTNE